MRVWAPLTALVFVLGACNAGDEPQATTAPPASATTTTAEPTTAAPVEPGDVVVAWVEAVVASDTDALAALVEPSGFIVLAAIENAYTNAEISALLGDGVPAELMEEYWSTFRNSFAEVAGIPLRAVEVGDHVEFTMGDVAFAVVSVASDDASTEVITRMEDGRWELDLVASFGPAFAAQLRRLLSNAPSGPQGGPIREAFRSSVVPGLLAAFRQNPGNHVLAAELERMGLLLDG